MQGLEIKQIEILSGKDLTNQPVSHEGRVYTLITEHALTESRHAAFSHPTLCKTNCATTI